MSTKEPSPDGGSSLRDEDRSVGLSAQSLWNFVKPPVGVGSNTLLLIYLLFLLGPFCQSYILGFQLTILRLDFACRGLLQHLQPVLHCSSCREVGNVAWAFARQRLLEERFLPEA